MCEDCHGDYSAHLDQNLQVLPSLQARRRFEVISQQSGMFLHQIFLGPTLETIKLLLQATSEVVGGFTDADVML